MVRDLLLPKETAMPDPTYLPVSNPAPYVPPHALCFGGLGDAAVPVTRDTPLPVRGAALSLIERLNREGDPIGVGASRQTFTSFAAPTGPGTLGPAPLAPSPYGAPAAGRAVFVHSVRLWASTPIVGRVQMQGSGGTAAWPGVGSMPIFDLGFACGPTFAAQLPAEIFLRSSDKAAAVSYVNAWLDPAVAGTHTVMCASTAWTLADSINFDARRVILMLGDSTWNGTGPSDVRTCIPWLVNRFYRDQGVDCRYILKAYSGSTTVGHESYRQGGKYDFEQVDLILVNLGINDAGSSVPLATSMANLQALVAWKQRRYPAATLVILGTTPVELNAQETALAALRSGTAAMIAALGDPRVAFCDLAGSFDRSAAANYVASDTAGSRVHPGDAGLTQVWEGGYGGNAGLRAWLAARVPRF